MQSTLNSFITEIGVATTIGIGMLILKNKPMKVDKRYEQFEKIKKSSFPPILDKFQKLEQDELFTALLNELEGLMVLSDRANNTPAWQFQMNRIIKYIEYLLKQILISARQTKNTEIITNAIECEEYEVGNIVKLCDTILQNSLLS